ncbi:hypothetical protein GCM10010198_30910 [Nocardia seriolae]|nr:hypothetical protein NS14008_31765 [Nocardia seriolae]BAW09964.1 hypothetical protein NSERUTF1_6904 [Nocardia seriolae]BEK85117.1 hypothetical protein NSERKGN1266_10680 [Nocardia seriolae]BEK99041.1 hypothetical protein NSER024013_69470 [Nocardia seriolae]GEM27036.1 hypothetical protein NS2_52750 [Nocardia seriolae NBRC 15557]
MGGAGFGPDSGLAGSVEVRPGVRAESWAEGAVECPRKNAAAATTAVIRAAIAEIHTGPSSRKPFRSSPDCRDPFPCPLIATD